MLAVISMNMYVNNEIELKNLSLGEKLKNSNDSRATKDYFSFDHARFLRGEYFFFFFLQVFNDFHLS